jgi:hypothetical protein
MRGRDTDPRALVPVGYPALRESLQSFIAVGLSKFVLRPLPGPSPAERPWRDELTDLADAVHDLQT